MDLERRLGEQATALTPSERRIGETILANPQLVAFGTVADVAEAARVGTATVVRFAVKLGFDGYSQLQASVQGDVSGQLRPAVERIRDQRVNDDTLAARHAEIEAANVRSTLDAVRAGDGRSVVHRLADDTADVLVLSGVASRGVALQFVGDLEQLRPGVRLLDGLVLPPAPWALQTPPLSASPWGARAAAYSPAEYPTSFRSSSDPSCAPPRTSPLSTSVA